MSISSRLTEWFLSSFEVAKDPSSRKFYKKLRRNAIRYKKGERGRPFFFGVKVERSVYCGMPYFVFIPTEVDSAKSILYLHGSAYMNGYRRAQTRFAAEIAKKTHAKVYFPLYPKLPIATVLPCFALLNNFFVFLRKKGEVIPVGDSSGGALALSLAAARREITEVIVISPWVSISLGEEGRKVTSDLMLSVGLLDRVARLWAYDLRYDDPRLSPIFGEFRGKTLFLICGEKERLRPDVLRFCKQKEEEGATVLYSEGAEQQHCYPLLPTAEGKRAREAILQRLQSLLYGVKR